MSTDNNSKLPQRPTTSQPPRRITSQPPQRTVSKPPERAASQPPKREASQSQQRATTQPPKRAVSQPPKRTASQPPKREASQSQQRATTQPPKRATTQPPKRAVSQPPKRTASQPPKREASRPTPQRPVSQKQRPIVIEKIDFSTIAVKYLGLVLGCLGIILAFFLSWLPEGLVSLAVAGGGAYYSYKGYKKESTSYVHIGGLFMSIAAITIIVLSMTTLGIVYKHGIVDNLCDAISKLSHANNVFNRFF